MQRGMKTRPKEILEGPILKVLLRLSVPSIIAFAFHTTFNFVDRLFVSRLGEVELGALGMAFTVQSVLLAIGSGTGIGASSLIARLIGSGKQKEANSAAEHVFLIIIGMSLLLTIAGPLLSRPVFILLGASEDMLPHILGYINIILFGSFFQFFAMIGNGILRGEGNMVKPMQVMLLGTAVNIVLDPVLIFGLGPIPALGVRGAAIATVTARAVSCLLLAVSLFGRRNIIQIMLRNFRYRAKYIKGIFAVGGPGIVSQLTMSLGLSLLFVLLRPFGDAAKTAFTMGFTYQQVAILPLLGIAQGVLTMTGQNYGAGNFHRVRAVVGRALLFAAGLMTAFGLLFIVAREPFVRVFTSDPNILSIGKTMMLIFSLGFPFLSGRIILSSFFQGLGMGFKALILNAAQMILFAIPLAILLSSLIGLPGIWTGMVVANTLTSLAGLLWTVSTARRLSLRSGDGPPFLSSSG